MAYIVTRKNRFYVVFYDGIDPTSGKERRRWQLAGTSALHARALKTLTADLITEAQPQTGNEDALRVATDIYTTWNGAVLSWSIDGTGTLATWIENEIRRALKTQCR